MAVADKNGAYAQKIEYALNERNGKLFLADSDKFRAASALIALSTKSGPTVCVVPNADVASDFADLIGDKSKCALIVSVESFNALINNVNGSGKLNEQSYKQLADRFKTKYPYVVVSVTDNEGKAVFNGKLCSYSSLYGTYVGAKDSAPYCVSDFLADCHYEFAIVDDVYGLLNFTEKDSSDSSAMSLSPIAYDCVSFMGKWYFSDVAHSYKRLQRLCHAAFKCALLSDVIIYDKFVELYAAINLLFVDEDLIATEKVIRQADSSYEELINSVCADINMAKSDEDITKLLLAKLRDSKQIIPKNIEALSNYIDICARYMSSKELFLRVMGAYIHEKGRIGNLDDALESLQDSNSLMASCLHRTFFSNSVKETMEALLTKDKMCLVDDAEVNRIIEMFNNYGICEQYYYDCDNVDTIRIMRDDSGYESFIEKHASFVKNNSDGAPVVDETEYSVIHPGSDLMYECATLAQICSDPNAPRKATLPVLLVTRDDFDETKQILKRIMPNWTVSSEFDKVSTVAADSTVILTDFARLEKSARKIGVKTVVFFGAPANPQRLLTLVNKCSACGSRSIIITRYGDLSARLSAKWNEIIERNTNRVLPLGMGAINVKNRFDDYDNAIDRIEEVYVALKSVALGESDDIDGLTNMYKKLLIDYADDSSLDIGVAKKDFNYLYHISSSFANVFKNSVSVGRSGEVITNYPYLNFVKDAISGNRIMLFNVCAKMLRRNCDGKNLSCNGCADYGKYRKNSFKTFEQCVHTFFDDTMEYARKCDAERQKESDSDKIHNVIRAEDDTLLTAKVVEETESQVLDGLYDIAKNVTKYKGVFATEYEPIQAIKSAIIELYARALDRYFSRIIAIFDEMSSKVIVRK